MNFLLNLKKKLKEISFINNELEFVVLNKSFSAPRKKILISYVSPEVLRFKKPIMHSNVYDLFEIIDYFVKRNYEVHLIKCTCFYSERYIKKFKYDVIFGLGNAFLEACKINYCAKKILYCTESSPKFSFNQESERVRLFNATSKNKAKIMRSNTYLTDEMLNVASDGIVIGNNFVLSTYFYCNSAIRFFSGIYPSPIVNPNHINNRHLSNSKNNFLWFGSTGVVHKGLHLAISAIEGCENYHLYVAGAGKKEQKLMRKCSNVTYLGRIDVHSESFIKLMNTVSSFILPSCSEAGSTATTTCLAHGLIPIISKETGVDLPPGYSYIENDNPIAIRNKMDEISSMTNENLSISHDEILTYALDKFSILKYKFNLEKILNSILQFEEV
jgi:hypothetical protein